MYIRVNDVKDKSKVNRINYLFRTNQIQKYQDEEDYVCFDQEEYLLCQRKKTGRKMNNKEVKRIGEK